MKRILSTAILPMLAIAPITLEDSVNAGVDNGGIDIHASRDRTGSPGTLNNGPSAPNSPPLSSVAFTPAPQPEYLRVIACPGNSTTHPGQDPCLTATTPCRDKPGTGVLTRIYTRPPGNPTTPWQHLTDTCDPQGYRKVGLAACRHRDVTRRVYTAGGHGGLRDRVGV